MKKIIPLLLFLSSLLFADAKVYLGTGYAYNSETISYNNTTKTVDNNALRLKIGYGDIKAYAIELSFDYIDNNSAIFDNDDGKKYEFNVELLKAFDFGIYINPFFKAGFGSGYLETPADQYNGSLSYGSFNLGTGFFLPINKHVDFECTYEYKNLSYQSLDDTTNNKPTSNVNILYLGVNYRF